MTLMPTAADELSTRLRIFDPVRASRRGADMKAASCPHLDEYRGHKRGMERALAGRGAGSEEAAARA